MRQSNVNSALEFAAPQSVAYQELSRSSIGGRDPVEPDGSVNLIIQTNVLCQTSSRSVIPNREADEGPYNRGLTFKGACVSVRLLARSLACARDDGKNPNPHQRSSRFPFGSLARCNEHTRHEFILPSQRELQTSGDLRGRLSTSLRMTVRALTNRALSPIFRG
jgi:hypothetical protein